MLDGRVPSRLDDHHADAALTQRRRQKPPFVPQPADHGVARKPAEPQEQQLLAKKDGPRFADSVKGDEGEHPSPRGCGPRGRRRVPAAQPEDLKSAEDALLVPPRYVTIEAHVDEHDGEQTHPADHQPSVRPPPGTDATPPQRADTAAQV